MPQLNKEYGKGRGWHGDPERHSLASRGVRTKEERIRDIPIKTDNKSIQGAASYNEDTEILNIIVNDSDKDRDTTIIQGVSIDPKSVVVEENEDIGSTTIKIDGKPKKDKKTRVSHTVIQKLDKQQY